MNNITNYFQKLKSNYHKETLKTTIDMAWPAIVESFFVAFAGLIDSLMVSSLGSSSVAAVGLTTQPKLLGLALCAERGDFRIGCQKTRGTAAGLRQ